MTSALGNHRTADCIPLWTAVSLFIRAASKRHTSALPHLRQRVMVAIADSHHVRVATYNVHKCRGLDGRVRPERIVGVLRELNADIIALQEVLSLSGNQCGDDHAQFIAGELGFRHCFGENRKHAGRMYGNALLSRFPWTRACNYDISISGHEPRGCLRANITLPGGPQLHLFNVHLGTSFRERRLQARRLISPEILNRPDLRGVRIVLGDFNEWTTGTTTRMLRAHFASPDLRTNRTRSYPGLFPILHLDHIYFDSALSLRHLTVHKSLRALVASDHLPFVMDLSLAAEISDPNHSEGSAVFNLS